MPLPRHFFATILFGYLASGCGQGELPGHYWDLSMSLASDNCNSPAVSYSEEIEYRLEIDVSDVAVSVGPDTFATGSLNGCTVTYDSVVWTEVRDQGDIQWTLHGEALAQRGDGACGIASDWLGTETFTVLSSEDESVRPGCTYVVDVTGSYIKQVE